MNIYRKKSKKFLVRISACGLLTLFLSSCSKAPFIGNGSTTTAQVNFIQASPDEPAIGLLVNSVYFSSPFYYGQNTGYLLANAGSDAVSFINDTNNNLVLTDTVSFKSNTNYSLFLANKPGQAEIVLLKDTLNQPAAGYATIRFVNLSPDAPAVDLIVKGGAVLAANKPYKGYSSFIPVQGNAIYTLEVLRSGTTTVLATLNAVKIETGSVNTVWFHGLVANTSTTDQLAVNIFNNWLF